MPLARPRRHGVMSSCPDRGHAERAEVVISGQRGAVTGCFVATPEFRLIREHTRYRRDLTGERTRERQRAEKLLESAAVKISSVLTDLHGMTGRDIMDHLIAGERDPGALAQLARGKARPKIARLAEALEGAEFFTPEHVSVRLGLFYLADAGKAQWPRKGQEPARFPFPTAIRRAGPATPNAFYH